jgi:excisionase family DNA binding protein
VSDHEQQSERYMTVGELADVMGIPAQAILRFHAEGRLTGRRMPGTINAVLFRRSDVEAAWDCVNQLAIAENEAA